MRMIHNAQWRWGIVIGLLGVLWIVDYPYLGHAGVVPPTCPACIGGDMIFFGSFLLILILMVVFVFIEGTRPLSFGMAVPFLIFQLWLLVQTVVAGIQQGVPWALLANLPGCTVLLIVGIVYYWERARRSRERLNRFPRS